MIRVWLPVLEIISESLASMNLMLVILAIANVNINGIDTDLSHESFPALLQDACTNKAAIIFMFIW